MTRSARIAIHSGIGLGGFLVGLVLGYFTGFLMVMLAIG